MNIPNSKLTSIQRKRFIYYEQQKQFITKMTDIAEKLRFLPLEDRNAALKNEIIDMKISSFCYLPLCNSLSNFSIVLTSLPDQSRAFNTKARYLSIYLSIILSIYLSIYLFIYRFIYLSIFLFIYLSIY
jgi:hypothetical protein